MQLPIQSCGYWAKLKSNVAHLRDLSLDIRLEKHAGKTYCFYVSFVPNITICRGITVL